MTAPLRPGTRVAVDDLRGVVVKPTAHEIAYARTEYDGERWTDAHVLVQLDGDDARRRRHRSAESSMSYGRTGR